MSKKNENGSNQTTATSRCLSIAKEGIETSQQLARYLSALMSDVIEGTVPPLVANAGVNAAGKLLKTVEMQHKYGTPTGTGGRIFRLSGQTEKVQALEDGRAAQIAALEKELAQLKEEAA